MIAATPLSLSAADAGSAILYAKGDVLRNGQPIPNSSPVVSGDLLETKAGSVANLNSLGSSIIIAPGSLVEFDGQSLLVEHGGVSVATSNSVSVRVRCLTVVPLSSTWTQFEVSDLSGSIGVVARKNDVRVNLQAGAKGSTKQVSTSGGDVVHEGQQTTRDESDACSGKGKKDAGAAPAGNGGWLTSDYVKYGALGILGGVGLWLILQPGNPPSPWHS